jgi:hypothetical protein
LGFAVVSVAAPDDAIGIKDIGVLLTVVRVSVVVEEVGVLDVADAAVLLVIVSGTIVEEDEVDAIVATVVVDAIVEEDEVDTIVTTVVVDAIVEEDEVDAIAATVVVEADAGVGAGVDSGQLAFLQRKLRSSPHHSPAVPGSCVHHDPQGPLPSATYVESL